MATPKKRLIDRYRTALEDAIRRPMGVIPDSAEGLLTHEDLDAAEERRPRSIGEQLRAKGVKSRNLPVEQVAKF